MCTELVVASFSVSGLTGCPLILSYYYFLDLARFCLGSYVLYA